MNKSGKKILSIILSMSMLLSSFITISAQTLPKPIASITFDESTDTAYSIEGGASIALGRDKNALLSTNINTSYATINDVSNINSLTGDFTFSIWCYPNDDKAWTRLYDIGTGTDKYIFLAPSSSFGVGYPRFAIKNNGYEQNITSSKILNLKEWNNITVTREGNLTSMYINGLLSATTNEITFNPADIGTTTQNYLIKSQYPDPFFNGMIDDFKVYDTALSAEEVQKLSAEAYQNELMKLSSEYDRYLIGTQFYNSIGKKIFQINDETSITAKVTIKNCTTIDGSVYARVDTYKNNIKNQGSNYQAINIGVAEEKTITVSDISTDCDYINIVLVDSKSLQEFDCGYIAKSSVVFPSPAPADSGATTFGAHDPSIFKDPKSGKYFAYSSHNLIFESDDLVNWTKHDYTKTITVPKSCSDFIGKNYTGTTVNGTYWAPDVIYVEGDEYPYWFYMSVSCGLGGRNSVIGLLKCKSPGIFDDEYIDFGVVLASKETTGYKTNAIDSNIYIDTDGKKYFVWGSFWQGIQIAPLNNDGTVNGINYTNDSTIISSSQNFAKGIYSVPNGVFGPEGPWMISNADNNNRYLFTSYGWLGTNYNIRIAKASLESSMETLLSTSYETAFTDHNSNTVGTSYSGQSDKSKLWGYKMIGSYQLGDGIVYYGNGHNSVLNDDDNNWYLVDHSRKIPDAAAYLQVRKMLWTESGWPVVSPLAYSGEQVQIIDKTMLWGTWDLSSVGQTILKDGITNVSSCTSSDADLPVLSSQIILQPDGKLGNSLGTWSFDGNHTVTITFSKYGNKDNYEFYKNGDIMTLYVLTGYDKDKAEHAVVMTGVDQNNISQFTKKANASVADTRPTPLLTQNLNLTKSTGNNPILGFDADGNTLYAGDPAATVIGDTVYLYAGHDTSTNNSYVMPEWVLYTSKDMVNWDYKGAVLKASDISWASNSTSAWAAQMAEYKGKYYLYFCTWDSTDNGKQSIGVAVADSPEGPFVDIGKPLIKGSTTTPQTSDYNDIDPTVWIETIDGVEHRYLAWGNGKYYTCELNEDMISVTDKNGDNVIDMNDIKTQKIKNLGSDVFTEAPWLYKRGNKYYTFFAANWRETIAYAISDSPDGPWTYCGQIMPPTATSNTNHPSVIDFNGKTYFIYHNGALEKGSGFRRSICAQELLFNDEGYVLPLTETSTGISGTKSTIQTIDGKYVAHPDFINPSSDSSYPLTESIIVIDAEDGLNSSWEIVKSKYESDKQEYVSIQSVNKPGLYITVDNNNIVLTQDADGTMAKRMTFKTVKGLNGAGVSFESVYDENKYLTIMGNSLLLSYGRDKDACTFNIGDTTPTPLPTAAPIPTPTPVPDLSADISNNFDNLQTGTLIAVGSSAQDPYTGIDGMIMHVGTRASATGSNISIESGGTTKNAIAINSGRFVSAARGPRIEFKTPTIVDNSYVSLTLNVKLGSSSSALRFTDSVSSDVGTTINGLSTSAWSKFNVTIKDTDGDRIRTISVNDTVIAKDAVETFPVLWGTDVNDTYTKVLLDDMSITTTVLNSYTIASVDGNIIHTISNASNAIVYAVKYNEDDTLCNVNSFAISKSGNNTFTADFEPDKIFIWSNDYNPYAIWEKQ